MAKLSERSESVEGPLLDDEFHHIRGDGGSPESFESFRGSFRQLINKASEFVALVDGATINLDWDSGINFSVTLGGDRSLGNPTNGDPGTWRTLIVTQDGTGGRLLSLGAQYKTPGGSLTLSTGAGAVDVLSILCVTSTLFYVFPALDIA